MTDDKIDDILEKISTLLEYTKSKVNSIENKIAHIENRINHTVDISENNFYNLNLVSRKIKGNDVINFAIILNNAEAMDTLRPIVLKLASDERFNLTVFSCKRRFPGSPRYIDEDKIHNYLDKHNIKHIRLNVEGKINLHLLKTSMPDGIIRQSQWDNDFPPELSTQNINFAKLYLISYEIMNLVNGGHQDEINSYFHQCCSLIFVANKYVLDAKSICNNRVVSGHPKVKQLINAKKYWPIEGDYKLKILWGAHHTITQGWTNFGTFLTIYNDMLEFAQNNPDISIVFHPHPGLITMLNNNGEHNKKIFEDFMKQWSSLNNTLYTSDTTYADYFKESDLLITDGLSLLIEYQIAKKPIIFIEREDHKPFNERGEFITTGVYRTKSASEAIQLVLDFKNGKDHEKEKDQDVVCNKYLTIDDYEYAEIKIANLIYDDIKGHSSRKLNS